MDYEFDQLVANWATDKGVPVTCAKARLMGTPEWVEARLSHAQGNGEQDVRAILDVGYREHKDKRRVRH